MQIPYGGFHRGLSSEIHANEERSAFHRDSSGRWYWGALPFCPLGSSAFWLLPHALCAMLALWNAKPIPLGPYAFTLELLQLFQRVELFNRGLIQLLTKIQIHATV